MKNRKSARKSRKRRKVELFTLKDEVDLLKEENDELRALVEEQKQIIEKLKSGHSIKSNTEIKSAPNSNENSKVRFTIQSLNSFKGRDL